MASRVSGVAPLAVFFDATGVTGTETSLPYHELYYRWTFGDSNGNAAWATGTRTGSGSKNVAYGPLAAHVFENAGSYTVTLTVFDGVMTEQETIAITVAAWSDATHGDTACFSNDTDHTGAPAGADTFDSVSDWDAAINTTAGSGATYKRILFKAGDTFTSSTPGIINADGPGLIGAYGTGDRPIVTGATSKLSLGSSTNHDFADWRVTGIDFDGVSSPGGSRVATPAGAASHILFHNCLFRELQIGFEFELGTLDGINVASQLAAVWNKWFFVDNTFTNVAQYNILGFFNESAVMGNEAIAEDQHTVRVGGSKIVVANNDLTGSPTGSALTVRGKAWDMEDRDTGNEFTLPEHSYTEYTVIQHNMIVSGGGNQVTYMSSNAEDHVHFRKNIFAGNWVQGAGNQTVSCGAGDTTIRNNLIENTSATVPANSIQCTSPEDATFSDFYVYHNTAFNNATVSGTRFDIVTAGGTTNNFTVTAKNNLGVAPNNTAAGTTPVHDDSGASSTITQANNSTKEQIQGTSPLATTPPTLAAHWQITAATYADGAGADDVPVFDDFFGNIRDWDTPNNDIGAYALNQGELPAAFTGARNTFLRL